MLRLLFHRCAAVVAALAALPALADAQQTRWYLAEGSTGPFFEEEVLAINPTDQTAAGFVRVYRDGTAVDVPIAIPPRRRLTLPVNAVPGLATGETSAMVDTSASGVPIFVERTMYWQGRRGGHNAGAIEAPQATWYLAEGATSHFFSTFILLVNPNPTAVSVTLRLLSDDGPPAEFPYTVAANSRLTVPVNDLPQFGSANFATVVTASQPVFVERAMYWLGFEGGHDATAVSSLSTTWRFAEGFTGGDFETYFLLANTGGAAVTATIQFFLDTGAVITKTVDVAATSRRTVRVRDYPDLVDTAFATRITSSAPIVAERAMYWGGFVDGHATAGLTGEATRWIFAEGLAGTFGGRPFETFYLFLNASSSPITLTGSFYREDGYGTRQTYTIPANSRMTLYGAAVPHMAGHRFGAVFEGSAPFIAERAVYWGGGRFGGHVSAGTPYGGPLGTPAEPPAPPSQPPPPPPQVCPHLVCDDLQGTSNGAVYGGGFDGFGYVITNDQAGIEWSVPTITRGFFEFELTGMRTAFNDEKYKIFAMYDGDWSSGNLYRATIEQRLPPRHARFKFLTGDGCDSKCGTEQRYIERDTEIPWNPADTYRVRLEWGDGQAGFVITSLSGNGQWARSWPYGNAHLGGIYNPANHKVAIGNPRAGGGEHGSFPGMRIRNVRIGHR
jgi:hypothetical protein